MSSGFEQAAAEEWLYATLTGDATLVALLPGGATAGISNTAAREGTPYPFVVYQLMSGIDYAAVGAFRIWSNLVYLVKAVGELDHVAALPAITARIDALLQRGSGVATDGIISSCVREQVIRIPETIAGKQFVHSGGLYRLYAS